MTTKKPRILHFIESEGVYGAERVILNLSRQLKISNIYSPVIGCIVGHKDAYSALYDAAIEQGLEATKIPITNTMLYIDLYRAAKQIKLLGIDLIHSHGYKPSVFGFIIKLRKKIPIIATCHLWFEPSKGPLKMRAMIAMEKFFYRWFPKVIAVSEPIKETLLKSGLHYSQVDLIPNGVENPEKEITSNEKVLLRQSLELNESFFCVLNSARLTRQKSQWVLVDAAKILKQRNESVNILIVGEGILKDELQTQIITANVNDIVKLLGFRSDIDKLLSLCDAFALPSIDEGMPMSLLEAAAAEKPIISTLVGDIGKLIQDEETGLIVPIEDAEALADAIIRLKNSQAFSKQLAKNAHKKMASNYSSDVMCRHYESVYKEIFNNIH